MDMGTKTEFKLKLTLKEGKGVYSQNVPRPMCLKEALNVELALMHKYDYHSTALVKKGKSHFCTEKTERKTTSPCGSQENQYTTCR